MKSSTSLKIAALLVGLMGSSVNAAETLNRLELKQQASAICVNAINETYGDDAVTFVRQRIQWQPNASRLHHKDGMSASVRLLAKLEGDHLSRVVCNVDQHQRIRLVAERIAKEESNGLLAIQQSTSND